MSSNIKIAQFGGVGGGYSNSYSPGASPLTKGSGGGPGGVNTNNDDNNTLNKQIERTHMDMDMSDDNIEARLSHQHKYYEENKNYRLTPEERLREKFRAKLHQMHEELQSHADSLFKNSPEYIAKHFQPKSQHIETYETQLEKRHQYKPSQKFQYEDEIVPQIKPSRIHYSISENDIIKVAQEIQKTRRNRLTDFKEPTYESEDPIPEQMGGYSPLGKTPTLIKFDQESDLDDYFQAQMNEKTPDAAGFQEYKLKDTILDYPDSDSLPNVYPRKEIANEPADNGILKMDPDVSIEGNLNPERYKKTTFDRNNIIKEDGGVEEVYDGSAFFGLHSPASFK
jgi:hypothetical protein